MPPRPPALIDRVVSRLARSRAPRSTGDLAQEFLGVGAIDEQLAERLLGAVLASDSRVTRTPRGWVFRSSARATAVDDPGLADRFLAVVAPHAIPVTGAVAGGGHTEELPRFTVAISGEGERSRYVERTGADAPLPTIDLAQVARRIHGYRGVADPQRIAEALGHRHIAADDPRTTARVIGSVWEQIAGQLALEGVTRISELECMLDERLEAADFVGKRFGPQELASLTNGPGVYAFRNARGRTLYVGQSGQLGARVRSYFSGPPRDEKDSRLRSEADSLETRAAESGPDALLTEQRWIRRFNPLINRQRETGPDEPRDGVLLAPVSRLPDTRGTALFVAFSIGAGELRDRVRLLPGPRRAPRAADRAVRALLESRKRPELARHRAAILVDRWRRAHPEAPFLELAIDGDAKALRHRIVSLVRQASE